MKKTLLFSILLLLLALSCKKNFVDDTLLVDWPEFSEVYAAHDTLPDSALVMKAFSYYDSLMPGRDYSGHEKHLSFQKARAYYFKAIIEEYDGKKRHQRDLRGLPQCYR